MFDPQTAAPIDTPFSNKQILVLSLAGGLIAGILIFAYLHREQPAELTVPADTAVPRVIDDPQALAEMIKRSLAERSAGESALQESKVDMMQAQIKIYSAESAAHAADILLCTKFTMLYDRDRNTLVPLKECPIKP